MKKSIFLAALCLMNVVLMAQDYELRVLTFENEDAQFSEYTLEYAGATITKWSDLIDDPQYGGPLTYANFTDAEYHWYDKGNTELAHTFPYNYAYCFWGGGHAISNYWGEGWSDEDRDTHIAKYCIATRMYGFMMELSNISNNLPQQMLNIRQDMLFAL